MRAISRICGNEGQPGLQLVEKLATPLLTVSVTKSIQKVDLGFTLCSDHCIQDVARHVYLRGCRTKHLLQIAVIKRFPGTVLRS